jgi:hypothetical protein
MHPAPTSAINQADTLDIVLAWPDLGDGEVTTGAELSMRFDMLDLSGRPAPSLEDAERELDLKRQPRPIQSKRWA